MKKQKGLAEYGQTLYLLGTGGETWTRKATGAGGFWIPCVYQFHHSGMNLSFLRENNEFVNIIMGN